MTYLNRVEQEFNQREGLYRGSKRNGTSCNDVLQFMYENKYARVWWWSWEFVGKKLEGGKMLSHRAPARASDLAIHTPELVEDRRIGRFKVYRIRLENADKVTAYLEGG